MNDIKAIHDKLMTACGGKTGDAQCVTLRQSTAYAIAKWLEELMAQKPEEGKPVEKKTTRRKKSTAE